MVAQTPPMKLSNLSWQIHIAGMPPNTDNLSALA